jgi:hypothetical protein
VADQPPWAQSRGVVRNANDPASLRLGIELHAGVGGMTGAVRDERGGCHPFSGWLGLLSVLEAARAGTLTLTTERSSACPTTEPD